MIISCADIDPAALHSTLPPIQMKQQQHNQQQQQQQHTPCERNTKVFFVSNKNDLTNVFLPDSFYNASDAEVKAAYKQKHEPKTLMFTSVDMGDNNNNNSSTIFVRVRFPDKKILQGEFNEDEPGENVMSFVKNSLRYETVVFSLFSPPKIALNMKQTLKEQGFARTHLLHLSPSSSLSTTNFLILKEELENDKKELEENKTNSLLKDVIKMGEEEGWGETEEREREKEKEREREREREREIEKKKKEQDQKEKERGGGGGEKKVPKWFKPTGR